MPEKRRVLRGQTISSGITLGTCHIVASTEFEIPELSIAPQKVSDELALLDRAVTRTIDELTALRHSAARKMGGPVVKIFDAQLMIAGDAQFLNEVKREITDRRKNAASVYAHQVQESIAPLKHASDTYLQQMAIDIESVAQRVLAHLIGKEEQPETPFTGQQILVGPSFSPSDVLIFRNRKAVGFVCGEGGKNSHMALIARSLMMPSLVIGSSWTSIPEGSRLIIDGPADQVIIYPTDTEWTEYTKQRKRLGAALVTKLRTLSFPPRTADGTVITVAANLELPGTVDEILSERNVPVGLFRTEFLYLEAGEFPDERAQTERYREIAETYASSYVVLRTFDLGSDKMPADALGKEAFAQDEENPALGWRGIRPMLALPEIFLAQIRAILRASSRRNVRILIPMITDAYEVEQVRKLIRQAMTDLKKERVAFDEGIKVGVMIEVPSAAISIGQILPLVDFIAIGTNDLTQYVLAADRNNVRVASLYNPLHPSLLALLERVNRKAMEHGKPVCVCGELAGDVLALPLLIGMGMREFSMHPARIFDAVKLIKKIDIATSRALVSDSLGISTASAVLRRLQAFQNTLD